MKVPSDGRCFPARPPAAKRGCHSVSKPQPAHSDEPLPAAYAPGMTSAVDDTRRVVALLIVRVVLPDAFFAAGLAVLFRAAVGLAVLFRVVVGMNPSFHIGRRPTFSVRAGYGSCGWCRWGWACTIAATSVAQLGHLRSRAGAVPAALRYREADARRNVAGFLVVDEGFGGQVVGAFLDAAAGVDRCGSRSVPRYSTATMNVVMPDRLRWAEWLSQGSLGRWRMARRWVPNRVQISSTMIAPMTDPVIADGWKNPL
jgi:hypothetical protein